MEKLTISEKTEITQKLKKAEFFYDDLELFKKKFPYSKLNSELTRINLYNQDRLHGQVIYNLLDEISEEEIKANRKKKAAELKAEAEAKAQQEADAKAKEEAELKAQQEADAKTKEEAELPETDLSAKKETIVEKKTATRKGQSNKSSQK